MFANPEEFPILFFLNEVTGKHNLQRLSLHLFDIYVGCVNEYMTKQSPDGVYVHSDL